ncbi:MAG: DUF177 domain-containing protein [Clostridiales bacterium]|nr:DUF177 domain-containing protein [Clostridiales bacterium]
MTINISEILANPSVTREYEVAPDFDVRELKQGSYPVGHKETFVLTIAKEQEEVHVFGETEIRLLIPCDRCLDEVEMTFPIRVDFRWNPDKITDDVGDAQDITFMDGCIVDVDKLVTDEIVVALPTKILCKEDCKGLCSVCGTNLNHGTCDCDRQVLDPRMAAIQDIFQSFQP